MKELEPMDVCDSDKLSPVLHSPASAARDVDMAEMEEDAGTARTDVKDSRDDKDAVDLKDTEAGVMELEAKDADESEMQDDSINVTRESLDTEDIQDTSVDEDADSSIRKDVGGEKMQKKANTSTESKKSTKPGLKKGKDDKENQKTKMPLRGRPLEKKKPETKVEKPKLLRRTSSMSGATDTDKSQPGKSLKAVVKKDSGKPEAKKPKVGSRIAEYIKSPTSDSGKDAKENENNSKFSKNIVNKKKADIISNAEKKVTVNMVRRASAPVPKLDLNSGLKSTGPKSARTEKEEEGKKTINRNPPKSKWNNIMSQINENTEKKPGSSKPTPAKSKLATTPRTGGTSPRPAGTLRPAAVKTPASKTPADKPASRASSVASRTRPARE